jgi:SPP1 family predicted phage head-tail adaptor
MPELEIGKLDRLITIQALTQSTGTEYSEPLESWADWAKVWANVYSGAGREFEMARQITAEIDTMFQIRYRSGVVDTMRISYDGRIYDIYRIQEVNRKRRLNVFCKARHQ